MEKPRFAVFGDVHGNWEALSAVLQDAEREKVTRFACVGDIVGYNADPERCLDRIMELDCVTVRGNHDHYCVYEECMQSLHPLAAGVLKWTLPRLNQAQVNFLKNLRMDSMVSGIRIVHSTLDMPEHWGYVFDELEAEAHFAYQNTTLCFYGHTHVPMIFEKGSLVKRIDPVQIRIQAGRKYFINVGSVGQPRDGNPEASYVIYDAGSREVFFRRVSYDLSAAQEKIKRAGLPERLAVRLALGR